MKKIKESLTNDLKGEINKEIMSIPSFGINSIEAMKDINTYNKELSEDEETTEKTPDFYKSVYNPDDKSVIAAYLITGETDKMIEVLNLIEKQDERSTFLDNVRPFSFVPQKIKLPKSQIEIIGDVEGKEGLSYIKIPYWLFKKNQEQLKVSRIKDKKRYKIANSQGNETFMKKLKDLDIDKFLRVSGDEDDVKTLQRYRDYYDRNFGIKDETKEATSSGASGQYSQPLFGETEKVEATEATSTSSSGQYSTPAFVAKNSKNWRGGKKPIFPGGKFVKVKEKCKKFPYCNQGDINALKLTESDVNKFYMIFENNWEKDAKNNIEKTFDKMPKLKDLKQYGLKYSVKSLKNLLMKKTKPDGSFGDNKWNRDELPFPKELDILNVIFQSRLAKFYFIEQAKKKGKYHYDFANLITKESLDNFPIPEPIFISVVQTLLEPKDSIIETTIKKIANKYNLTESVIRTLIKNNFKETGNNSNQ
jgi:hypothetical protein